MFTPYPKMSHKLAFDAKLGGSWTASEKIHGANVAIICEADAITPCRRRAPLTDSEIGSFFGLAIIWPITRLQAMAIFEQIGEPCHIYGELCGGLYPEHKTPREISPVQGGIYYSPTLEYFVFDIYLPTKDLWLSDSRVREICESIGMHTTPRLAQGKYQKIMALPVKFQSVVSSLLGYEHVPQNLAEGYVAKPDRDMTSAERIVIKRKREAFQDTIPTKYRPKLESQQSLLLIAASNMLTPARVWSARSKVGPSGHLHQEFFTEMVEDLVGEGFHLDEKTIEFLIKHLQEPVDSLINKYAL